MKKIVLSLILIFSALSALAGEIQGSSVVMGQHPLNAPVITIVEGKVVSQSMYNIPMNTTVLVEEQCAELSGDSVVLKTCYAPRPWSEIPMNKRILNEIND